MPVATSTPTTTPIERSTARPNDRLTLGNTTRIAAIAAKTGSCPGMSHPTISQAAIMAIVALAVWMSGGRRVVRNAERTPIAVRLARDKTQPCPPCCSPRSAHQPQRQDPSGTTGAGGDVREQYPALYFLTPGTLLFPEPCAQQINAGLNLGHSRLRNRRSATGATQFGVNERMRFPGLPCPYADEAAEEGALLRASAEQRDRL